MTDLTLADVEWERTQHSKREQQCIPSSGWERGKPETFTWEVVSATGMTATPRPRSAQTPVAKEIGASRWILDLPPNWDGDGAYAFERATWDRAAVFLLSLARRIETGFGVRLEAPRILPSANGSIDLHWKTDRYELLINVPSSPGDEIRYYGDNLAGNMPIESACSPSEPDRKLVAWVSLFL